MTALDEAAKAGTAFAYLAEIDLPSGVVRVWNGAYALTTLDAKTWQPLGQFGRVGKLKSSSPTVSDSFEMELRRPWVNATLGDRSDLAAEFKADFKSAIRGRRATLYIQFFTPGTTTLVDDPQVEATGRMGNPEARGGRDTGIHSLVVRVTGLLADGTIPPRGLATDADQRARYADDGIFRYLPLLPERARNFVW